MRIFILLGLLLVSSLVSGQEGFDRYFNDKVLRFDFMLSGNDTSTLVYPMGMKEEPSWSGSLKNLIDPFDYGSFKYELFDSTSNILIYSRGFCTLFQEWQTTAEAKVMQRSFYEVATMPYPKNKVRFVLSIRERNGEFSKLYETVIDPEDYFIRKEQVSKVQTSQIHYSGDPHECVDFAFLAEGYTAGEMEKFRKDAARMADLLLKEKPFSEFRDKINIWAVEAVSADSGTDIPGEKIYRNTAMNASFYTFDLDRYLTTQDIKSVNDFAAAVPHDNIIVLINSNKYGGGGVYNYYSGTTVDHALSAHVFLHELGHGFAGLADEYYESTVAYDEFYPLDVEPWEPNITTLVNFESKWEKMLDRKTPVPTPPDARYMNTTGVFEGGGYSAKGIYRPQVNCRMKSNTPDGFCTVCREAVRQMILFYTE